MKKIQILQNGHYSQQQTSPCRKSYVIQLQFGIKRALFNYYTG